MSGKAFVDTNVLLYAYSNETTKADRAEALARTGGVISVQVLNEFTHVARRKFRIPWAGVRDDLALIQKAFAVEPITLKIHQNGLAIAQATGFGIYDSLLLASALQADCSTFWSEDLQHGQIIESRLTIRNPFLQD